jgi:hypothetical protein
MQSQKKIKNEPQNQSNQSSNIRPWLTLLAVVWLLGLWVWLASKIVSGYGWADFLSASLSVLGFRWWVQLNMVQDQCPVCSINLLG